MKLTDEEIEHLINENEPLGRRPLHEKYPHIKEGTFRRVKEAMLEKESEVDFDAVDEETYGKMIKQKQALMDKNRIVNSALREKNRQFSAIEVLNKQFVECFRGIDLPEYVDHSPVYMENSSIVVTLADFHAQEQIREDFNQYDFVIMGQRLRKFAQRIIETADFFQADEIVVIGLGDMINSDRRTAEIMANAVNRTRASIAVAHILKQFLLELYEFYPVRVSFVYGNESRVGKEVGFDDAMLSDNFDYSIYNMLKMFFGNTSVGFEDSTDQLTFEDGRGVDQIIEVKGKNFLATHGNSKGFGQDPRLGVDRKIIQQADTYRVFIDYVVFGHLHGCFISDRWGRSGSLCGGNSWSHHDLGFTTKASQNLYVVTKDEINGMRVDLQESSNFKTYDIDPNILGYTPR